LGKRGSRNAGNSFCAYFFGTDQYFPDFCNNGFQKVQIALFGDDRPLPVPLVDIGGVIVIKEVIFANGAHVGADALTGLAVKFLQREPLPLGRGLNHLRIDGMHIAIVRNMKLDWSARAITVEHVIDAALDVHDQRHLDHDQVCSLQR
jgi:hypothetical protein